MQPGWLLFSTVVCCCSCWASAASPRSPLISIWGPTSETVTDSDFTAGPGSVTDAVTTTYGILGNAPTSGPSDNAAGTTRLVFSPEDKIYVEEEATVELQVTVFPPSPPRLWASKAVLSLWSEDTDVATVQESQTQWELDPDRPTSFNLSVHGVFVGYSRLLFKICFQGDNADEECDKTETIASYLVAVLRVPSVLQKMFPYLIGIVVSINYINMGCQIDLRLVLDVLKKPIPPLLGCACQFIFMPLVSYGIGLLLLENALMRFGIFVLGSSPGGNSSNLWTLMFDGDVTLSITMTFISTIASIGMMPLWVFLLGRNMSPETGTLKIPFGNIVASLIGLAIPLAIGMLIRRFKPKWAQNAAKYIKPMTLVVLVVIVVLSATVNKYIFLLMTWKSLLCGALVSWSAYVFGALAAFLGRLNRGQIIAVAIEVAFQNSGIAVVILYSSLSLPDSDLVIVPVVCQTILQGVPLYVLYLFIKIRDAVAKCAHTDEKVEPAPCSDTEMALHECCKELNVSEPKRGEMPAKDVEMNAARKTKL